MNREQMIEKAADAIHSYHGCTNSCEFRGCDLRPERAVASAVLHAILPQVSTVEELEALPVGTVVVDSAECAYGKLFNGYWGSPGDEMPTSTLRLAAEPPLTVVWQP